MSTSGDATIVDDFCPWPVLRVGHGKIGFGDLPLAVRKQVRIPNFQGLHTGVIGLGLCAKIHHNVHVGRDSDIIENPSRISRTTPLFCSTARGAPSFTAVIQILETSADVATTMPWSHCGAPRRNAIGLQRESVWDHGWWWWCRWRRRRCRCW